MTAEQQGDLLVHALLTEPGSFWSDGRSHDLLSACLDGYPISRMATLLESDDVVIQRIAMFVISELGVGGCSAFGQILPFIESRDRYLAYRAMETAALCCTGQRAEQFSHVILRLESEDPVIRDLAERLVSNAEPEQLHSARRVVARTEPPLPEHLEGLTMILAESLTLERIAEACSAPDRLTRQYGAIAARRLRNGRTTSPSSPGSPR